ncbi:MAG: hypothetical protein J6V23_05505 [Bacteroidaceae bacterium]|jgi:hypothetical protein|nr:hypothetical protein [Bacteroidaceae bacterium]
MIDKELSEILDALTRETGDPMPPCEELAILGYDPFGQHHSERRRKPAWRPYNCYNIGEVEEEEGVEYNDYNTDEQGEVEEEYEFDENNEEYQLLEQVLRINNDRRKYFA